MTKQDEKYYKSNYEIIFTSINGINIGDSIVNYILTKRKSNNKEFIVWIERVIDMSDFGLENLIQNIKVVVFSETEHGALTQAFKRYFKGKWNTFRFGKDNNIIIN